MAIDKILQKITTSTPYIKAGKAINNFALRAGKALDSDKFEKIINPFEPTNGNNSFFGLTSLMVFCTMVPRVRTALKRNPDNKEATIDEIKEILIRDVQTILIILFALKSANAIVANFAAKKTGLPMTTKPYDKLFDDSVNGLKEKTIDFISHPIQKMKIIGKNVLEILNPIGGNRAFTNEEYISRYSNYSFDSLPKLLKDVDERRGNSDKTFERILDGTIERCENFLNGNNKKGITSFDDLVKVTIDKNGNENKALLMGKNNLEKTIADLKALKEQGQEGLNNVASTAVRNAIEEYMQDEANSLVQKGTGINGWLRTIALIGEASYLGFGLPALNQRRLEKKYLKNNPQNDTIETINSDKNSGALISKNIKAHEVKLYHNFIK